MAQIQEKIQAQDDPVSAFLYALKAPESRRQYPKRLKMLFDFLSLNEPFESQALEFVKKAKGDSKWAYDCLVRFISYQKQRVTKGEIVASTISNYYKAAKLFCEMNDLTINWKKISRGIPRGRHAANDRAPTLEELRKLADYPDRRIKPIISLMVSTGIRIGAFDSMQWKHIIPIHGNDGNEVIAAKLIVYPGDISAYCASKFGMMGLTESLAWEVGNYDIRVMSICPGEVATKMQEDVDPHYYELNKHKMLHPKTVAEKITDMVFDDRKYGNGVSVDLPN